MSPPYTPKRIKRRVDKVWEEILHAERSQFLRDNPRILLEAFELLEERVDAYGDEYFTEQEMPKDTIDKFRAFIQSLRHKEQELKNV